MEVIEEKKDAVTEEMTAGQVMEVSEPEESKKKVKKPLGKKKWIIVAAAAIALGYVGCTKLMPKGTESADDLTHARNVTLEKGSLDEAVQVSGVVKSASVSTVTSTLNAKVVSVNVKLGDVVSKGDVICTLDTSDIDRQIADQQRADGEASKALLEEVNRAQNAYNRALSNKNDIIAAQNVLVDTAQKAFDAANGAVGNDSQGAKAALNAANSALNNANAEISKETEAVNNADGERTKAYENWQYFLYEYEPDESITDEAAREADKAQKQSEAQAAYEAAETAYTAAETQLNTAKTVFNYEALVSDQAAKQADYDAKTAALESADTALKAAKSARDAASKEADEAIAMAKETLDSARNKSAASSSALNELMKQKQNAVLKAETAGEITDLNVTVGSLPKDTIAVIQSTTDLVLEVSIPEADINRVSEGLPARITADSIKEEAAGTLIQISSTADTTENASGYKAQIRILNIEGLHIGSKAKASIVLKSKPNVFTVPIDAVGTDDSGNSYIRVFENGSYRNVNVTTGDSNDYMIEIQSSELKEGMEVLSDANYEQLQAESGKKE